MILEMKAALDHHVIHLTEDNVVSLKDEISEIRNAFQIKYPDTKFPHILPYLDPENIMPKEALFEIILQPNPEADIYGNYGLTFRSDRIPYSIFLAKWIGIQVQVETPFIEELLLLAQKMNNDEEVYCQNSQWRHEYFQKRRAALQNKLKGLLKKEIMDLLTITQQFKDGTLIQEAGFFNFWGAFIQRKLLNGAWD